MHFDAGTLNVAAGRRTSWVRLLLRVRDRVLVRGRGLVLGMDGAGGEAYRSIWNTMRTGNIGRCIFLILSFF